MNIYEEIIRLREKMIKENKHLGCDSPYQINNGWCDEFCRELEDLFKDGRGLEIANFTDYHKTGSNDTWARNEDGEYLINFWGKCNTSLSPTLFEYHIWFYFNGKHYDAECPEGVENFMELPIFKKRI